MNPWLPAFLTELSWPSSYAKHNIFNNLNVHNYSTYLLVLPTTNLIPKSRLQITSMLCHHHIYFCPLMTALLLAHTCHTHIILPTNGHAAMNKHQYYLYIYMMFYCCLYRINLRLASWCQLGWLAILWVANFGLGHFWEVAYCCCIVSMHILTHVIFVLSQTLLFIFFWIQSP